MEQEKWFYACNVEDMPHNGGVCVKYKEEQIALFYFTHRDEWYATQNLCPHRHQMAISRGMLGSQEGEPKIACPFHKKTFSLRDGHCMNDGACGSIKIFEVRVRDGQVYINVEKINQPIKIINYQHEETL